MKKYIWILVALLVALNVSLAISHGKYGYIAVRKWLFLWFLASTTDTIAAALASLHLRKMRAGNRLVLFYTLMLWGIVLEGVCVLMGSIYPPTVTDYGLWYSIWFWSGRWTKTFAVWMLVLYQIGALDLEGGFYMKKPKKEKQPKPKPGKKDDCGQDSVSERDSDNRQQDPEVPPVIPL